MLRLGLTGGIACGKSLVAGLLRARGIPVVDDDQAARDAVAPGTRGLAAVVQEFGSGVLLPDGSLDRAGLGRIVFADDRLRLRLMAITFPWIGELVQSRLAEAEKLGAPAVVYESALLIENGQADHWRPLIVVTASEAQQVARLVSRNALSAEEARARIASQMTVAAKAAAADFVIDNSGSPTDAERQLDDVLGRILSRPPA
jgi:dephospho-CoA kinase